MSLMRFHRRFFTGTTREPKMCSTRSGRSLDTDDMAGSVLLTGGPTRVRGVCPCHTPWLLTRRWTITAIQNYLTGCVPETKPFTHACKSSRALVLIYKLTHNYRRTIGPERHVVAEDNIVLIQDPREV